MTPSMRSTPDDGSGAVAIRATRDDPPADWDARVRGMGGNAFHGTGWAAVATAAGGEAWYLEFLVAGEPVGFAVAAGARSRRPFVGWRRSELLLNTTPLIRGDVALTDAANALRAFARGERFGRLQCSAYASLRPPATESLRDVGFTVSPRLEFALPLAPTLDATLAAMSSTHRRNIRKAMSAGFQFREDSTLRGARVLRGLQDTTYARRWEMGQTDAHPMPEVEYERTMEAWLRAGGIRFWLLERDGRPVSALGILLFGARAYYLVGGTAASGYEIRAPFGAFGHVIRELCAAGVTELHLGGVPAGAEAASHPDHGLYRFKRGFGADPVMTWDARART
jgi:Acetyltransferase (GNAT) domain